MSTFREFEHAGWEDPATCAGLSRPARCRGRPGGRTPCSTGCGWRRRTGCSTSPPVAVGWRRRPRVAVRLRDRPGLLGRAATAGPSSYHPRMGFARADADRCRLPHRAWTSSSAASACRISRIPWASCGSRGGCCIRPGASGFTVWAPPGRSPDVRGRVRRACPGTARWTSTCRVGPDFFRYADPATAAHDLAAAGFVDVSGDRGRPDLGAAPRRTTPSTPCFKGTVRTAALLIRQPAGVLAEVRRADAGAAGGVRRGRRRPRPDAGGGREGDSGFTLIRSIRTGGGSGPGSCSWHGCPCGE